MKSLNLQIMKVMNDYAADYSIEELLEELFPSQSIGELISDMFDAGLIPADVLEKFLED